jgi:hypothetical protein
MVYNARRMKKVKKKRRKGKCGNDLLYEKKKFYSGVGVWTSPKPPTLFGSSVFYPV